MSKLSCARTIPVLMFILSLIALSGCGSPYLTPGGGADFAIFADDDIREILDRKPVAPFPAHLAVARVQAPEYRSYTCQGYGRGRFSVVTVRDVETEDDFARLAALPDVAQVVAINRLLLSDELNSDRPLRQAAASLHADLLMVYTFDTDFFVGDALRPLTVISLGLSPNQDVRVVATASAMLVDVRTGYVYGACETTCRTKQLASAWTSDDAVDRSRLKTEREAFEKLLGDFEVLWKRVVADQRKRADRPTTRET